MKSLIKIAIAAAYIFSLTSMTDWSINAPTTIGAGTRTYVRIRRQSIC